MMGKLFACMAFVNWLYMQYSYVTALNILDKFERYIFNSVVLLILGIFVYSAHVFLPSQLYTIATSLHAAFNNAIE